MNARTIKFAKPLPSAPGANKLQDIFVESDNGRELIGQLFTSVDMYYQNDGTQRELIAYYHATVNGKRLFEDVRNGSRYTGGTLVQTAAEAKRNLKTQILECL